MKRALGLLDVANGSRLRRGSFAPEIRAYLFYGGHGAPPDLLTEFTKQLAQKSQAFRSEPPFPVVLDLPYGLPDDQDHRLAARREMDAPGAQVVRVVPTLEIAEALQLAEQVVDGLLARSQSGRELGRLRSLRTGEQEDTQVRHVEVAKPPLMQPLEHAPAHGFPRNPKQRADERRPEGSGNGLGKMT